MNDTMHALANAITEKFILAAPKEAAKALESLATHEILLLTSPLKAQVLVRCLNEMTPLKAAALLRRLPLKQASHIFMLLDVNQAAKCMREFSGPYRERLSAALPPSFLQMLSEVDSYAPQSAGRLMQTDFVAVKTDSTVKQLIERLKNLPRTKLPSVCFVTAKDGTLKGFIRTPELAFYDVSGVCGSVMTPCQGILPQLSGEQLATYLKEAPTDWVPVVNDKQILLGVLSRFTELTAPEKPFWQKWSRKEGA